MKKIILLLVIVIAVPIIIIEDSSKDYEYYNNNYPDLPKKKEWEKVKNTFLNNRYNPHLNVQRFKGPILVSLPDATISDSVLVNSAILKLKALLPHKTIDYFESYTGRIIGEQYDKKNTAINGYNLSYLESLTIQIYFNDSLEINKNLLNKKEMETSIDRAYNYFGWSKEVNNLSGLWKPKVKIDFNEDSNINKRKRIVEFGLMKVLACKSEFLGTLNHFDAITDREERMDETRFLLEKLYTPTIVEDFKTYLYETYPWRYVSNYLNNKKLQTLATWVCISLVIVLSLLGFGLLYKKDFKYQFLNYFLPILFFMITVLYVYKLYNYLTDPRSFEHWKQYISIHVIFIITASFIALCLFLFDKYLIKKDMSFTMQLILKIGFTFLICLSPLGVINLLENNHNSQWYYQVNPIFLLVFMFAFGRALLLYLDNFSENLVKQKDIELSNLKALKSQAEVSLLQSQINPHFLYNALNSIASLAQKDGAKTEKMVLSLSDLFKYTINRKGKKNSTIGDEVEMVKNYLEVEQIRFGDRLIFNIEVDENLDAIKIPMFLIQPLVENAIKHGVSKVEKDGEVQLIIKKQDNNLLIKVLDNGPQFPDGLVSGHGLQTVYDLLKLSYGDRAIVNIQNEPQKEITITIKNIV